MLDIGSLSAGYGAIEAVRAVSIRVQREECVAIIGANGAGKTTLLSAISGLIASSGTVVLNGEPLETRPSHVRTRLGLALVPEGKHVFPDMTVKDNLLSGSMFAHAKAARMEQLDFVHDLFPRLKDRTHQRAGTMSGGEQGMLAIGRALMSAPKLLMLDEPSSGLDPQNTARIMDAVSRLNREGLTVLMVEQNAKQALEVSSRAYVLDRGSVLLEADSRDLIADPRVRDSFLGKAATGGDRAG